MTATVHLSMGDSLELHCTPEDGKVTIWGLDGSKDRPDAVIYSERPFTLYTERVIPCRRRHPGEFDPPILLVVLTGFALGVLFALSLWAMFG